MSDDEIRLRPVDTADLPTLFEHQRDADAQRMVAFSPRDPNDREAFMTHWAKIIADPGLMARAITRGGAVVGHIGSFPHGEKREVGYWIDRAVWGQGVATRALTLFLTEEAQRPLHAAVAKDNDASRRVLEKCGFRVVGEGRGFSRARNEEIGELILELAAPPEDDEARN